MIVITPRCNFGVYTAIADEPNGIRCDGTLLPFSIIGTTYTVSADDSLVTAVYPALTSEEVILLVKKIDHDVDAIYAESVGNRVTEYALAEQEAIAYKADGYTGDVPQTVQSWASAKGQTAKWASDDMIVTANGWRVAQGAMRAQRLTSKESARKATTIVELMAIASTWDGFVSYIRSQLGI